MKWKRSVLALALVTGMSAPVQAQARMSEAARNYYESGSRAFAEGHFEEAARAFREAHNISHLPELLFNIGHALEASGDDAGALDALTLFRDGGAPGYDRATLDRQLEALRQRIEAHRVQAAQAAQAAQAGQQAVVAPPVVRERTVIQPAWYRVEYRRSTVSTVVPWVLVGVGGALAIVGGVQGFMARGDINTINDVNRGNAPWSSSADDALGRASGEATRSYIFTGVGAAMVIGGVVWLLVRGPGTRTVVNTAPQLTLVPTGTGLAIGGTL